MLVIPWPGNDSVPTMAIQSLVSRMIPCPRWRWPPPWCPLAAHNLEVGWRSLWVGNRYCERDKLCGLIVEMIAAQVLFMHPAAAVAGTTWWSTTTRPRQGDGATLAFFSQVRGLRRLVQPLSGTWSTTTRPTSPRYVVYDDSSDVTPIWDDEEVVKFNELQQREDVVVKRNLRQKLRALSRSGGSFHWPFSQMETHTYPDGTREVSTTDSEGRMAEVSTTDSEGRSLNEGLGG